MIDTIARLAVFGFCLFGFMLAFIVENRRGVVTWLLFLPYAFTMFDNAHMAYIFLISVIMMSKHDDIPIKVFWLIVIGLISLRPFCMNLMPVKKDVWTINSDRAKHIKAWKVEAGYGMNAILDENGKEPMYVMPYSKIHNDMIVYFLAGRRCAARHFWARHRVEPKGIIYGSDYRRRENENTAD